MTEKKINHLLSFDFLISRFRIRVFVRAWHLLCIRLR